jgi:hypothetical protein
MRLVVNDEEMCFRHRASQQAGDVGSMLVQLVQQRADIGVGIDEESEQGLRGDDADDREPGPILNYAGREIPTRRRVAKFRARVDEGRHEGRKTVGIDAVSGHGDDWQAVPPEHNDGVYAFALHQRINNVANR